MKAVILAGGLGTRLSEETHLRPKPMVEIGGHPILWHIMKIFANHGINDFIICCGYKGYVIKEYFSNYALHRSDVTFDLKRSELRVHKEHVEDFRVTLIDTGLHTMTAGRLKRVAEYLDDESFFFTYGDGVSDVNLTQLARYHEESGKRATVTAVSPPARYGALAVDNGKVTGFLEKPKGDGALINGGFFVLEPNVMELIESDDISWESYPMQELARAGEMGAFVHEGFWHPMDTLRDRNYLENLWVAGEAPWRSW